MVAFPDGSFNYTPNAGFTGTDSFVYRIADGFGGFDTATVTITVFNTAPDAVDDSYSIKAGTVLTVPAAGFLANDTDADGDTVTAISIDDAPDNGIVVAFPDGSFNYTPNAGFTGTDSFVYQVADGFGGFDTATVTIDVLPANQAPTIVDVADQTVSELGVFTIDVDASDPDGDTVTFELVNGPDGAFIDTVTGEIVWSAPVVTPGVPIDFLVRASDGTDFSDDSFTVTVLPEYLRVSSFAGDANGFRVQFNRVFDVTTLNLYDGAPNARPLAPADVLLATLAGSNQAGSIVVDDDQKGFTFIRTGATLAAGDYRATLVSGAADCTTSTAVRSTATTTAPPAAMPCTRSTSPRRRRCCPSATPCAARARASTCPRPASACRSASRARASPGRHRSRSNSVTTRRSST